MAFPIALLVMLIAAPLGFVSAQDTTVDWKLGNSFATYSTQSFKAGDNLVFNYDKTQHNVLIVNKSDYDSCNTKNALQKADDGKTTITLKQGTTYFICGTPGHCDGGMKLQVNVGESGSPATPTTPATPKATPTTPTSTGSNPPSAPSPKDSSGSMSLSGAAHLIFGMSLAFGALFALLF